MRWLVMLVCLFMVGSFANAMEIAIDDLSVASFINFAGGEPEVLGGATTSLVEGIPPRESLSIDFGIIGTSEENVAFMAGLSANLKKLAEALGVQYSLSEKLNAGFFGAYNFELDEELYGVYVGAVYRF